MDSGKLGDGCLLSLLCGILLMPCSCMCTDPSAGSVIGLFLLGAFGGASFFYMKSTNDAQEAEEENARRMAEEIARRRAIEKEQERQEVLARKQQEEASIIRCVDLFFNDFDIRGLVQLSPDQRNRATCTNSIRSNYTYLLNSYADAIKNNPATFMQFLPEFKNYNDLLESNLTDYTPLAEFKKDMSSLCTHYEYLTGERGRRSVFSGIDNFEEKITQLKESLLSRHPDLTFATALKDEMYDCYLRSAGLTTNEEITGKKIESLYCLLLPSFCNEGEGAFDRLKELHLLSAFAPVSDEHEMVTADALKICYDMYFSHALSDEQKKKLHIDMFPTVDTVIVKAIEYSRGNIIDNVNSLLGTLLKGEIDEKTTHPLLVEEYETLRKAFAYLRAYKQEEMVLNALFESGLPRTAEQEARLAFLKKGVKNMPAILNAKTDENSFEFDYRSLKWNKQDILAYFEGLTMTSKVLQMPMVVEEWEQNISVSGITWNINEINEVIQKAMLNNFDARFVVDLIDAGVTTENYTEVEPSLYIYENQAESSVYPWLAFVVTGSQLTKTQVNLAIYSLFVPEKATTNGTTCAQKNEELCNALLILKEQQNPRMNTLTKTIKNILVEGIESWFNGNSASDIY